MGMANIPLTIKKRVSQKLMDKDEICDTLFALNESGKFPVDREYPIDRKRLRITSNLAKFPERRDYDHSKW